MSFLFKGKKIFIFIFLFLLIPFFSFAEDGAASSKATDFVLDGILGVYTFGMSIVSPLVIVFGFIAMLLANMLLGIAAYAFSLSLDIGVLGISDIVHGSDAIKGSWLIFRNIANVGIIFVILFIAIKTILRSDSFDQKFLLGKVIIAALLMNFSFFFGAIVVDVSNQMALTIYDKIGKITGQSDDGSANLGNYYFKKSNTALFMAAAQSGIDKNSENYFKTTIKNIGLTLINPIIGGISTIMSVQNQTQKGIILAAGYMLSAITSLVLAVVLFIGTTMIIGRIIAILLLLTVAPIAFASSILPNTEKYSKDWWGSLIGHSFFLPVFLLFILIGVQITEKLPESLRRTKDVQESVFDFAGLVKTLAPIAFNFGIIIGLFIAALLVAKKISSNGSALVGTISSSVTSATGGLLANQAAFIGRNTIGRTAEGISKTEWAQRMGSTKIGSMALNQMKGVAKSSFDARESRAFKGVASATGVGGDFNKYLGPQKGGFVGAVDRAEKARVARANNLSDQLTSTQEKEKNALTADIEADNQAMETMISSDSRVKTYENRIKSYQVDYEAAKARGDATAMKSINAQIESSQKGLEIEKARVKSSAAYTTLLDEQNKKIEKQKSIISAKEKYAENLGKPLIKNEGFGKVANWIPWNPRYADKSAAAKIKKSLKLTDEDKRTNAIISALRESK